MGGKLETKIRFMNFSTTVHDVMQLGHGTSEQLFLIRDYEKHLASLLACAACAPRDRAYSTTTTVQRACSDTPRTRAIRRSASISTEAFYYLGYNLYLVKTPGAGGLGKKSCIEDLFPPALLKTLVDGKAFDPNKEHDEAGKYGKVVFAKRVVISNAAAIDFSGFAPLLDRIVAETLITMQR